MRTLLNSLGVSSLWDSLCLSCFFTRTIRVWSGLPGSTETMFCRNQTTRATVARGSALEMEIRRGKFRKSVFLDSSQPQGVLACRTIAGVQGEMPGKSLPLRRPFSSNKARPLELSAWRPAWSSHITPISSS
ncbi:unnamed protein product [Pleuronectes platessa]|uniref:Uncharacterized protein n=1 Tax=Pleuronectes platessa TaxID=8262 RepID=A0A9N7VGM0_PLEPL|nr:unnamed protein product [Pleuronectes platessa]